MILKPQPLFDTYKTFMALFDPELKVSEDTSQAQYIAERPAIIEYLDSIPAGAHAHADMEHVRNFLRSYSGLETTFRSYRTQVERLMLWSWLKQGKSILDLTRSDAEDFMRFVLNPDPEWVGSSVRDRFIKAGEIFEPNPMWRPFGIQPKKSVLKEIAEGARTIGAVPTEYKPAQGSVRQVFAICSSFYDFANADGFGSGNPFRAIKQKSTFVARQKKKSSGKALSKLQWDFVCETAEIMAAEEPERHERTLFILVTLFSMYLRVSDLVGNQNWTPTMGAFVRSGENWWMRVIGKGNKEAEISVRPDYLPYLARYRASRNLAPMPAPDEDTPLITKLNGEPGLTDRQIRSIIQLVFDRALERMKSEGFPEHEIGELRQASLHWLRHTSATFDAPHRDIKHLQADMRHENMSTTQDIYYNTDDQERAASMSKRTIREHA